MTTSRPPTVSSPRNTCRPPTVTTSAVPVSVIAATANVNTDSCHVNRRRADIVA